MCSWMSSRIELLTIFPKNIHLNLNVPTKIVCEPSEIVVNIVSTSVEFNKLVLSYQVAR